MCGAGALAREGYRADHSTCLSSCMEPSTLSSERSIGFAKQSRCEVEVEASSGRQSPLPRYRAKSR